MTESGMNFREKAPKIPPRILCIGMPVRDLTFRVGGVPGRGSKENASHFDEICGGNALNAAIGIVRLGGRASVCGPMGDIKETSSRFIFEKLAHEGIDDRLRQAIIIYLLSHARPVGELLAVRPKDITAEYVQGFAGMTREPVSRDDLIATRDQLVDLAITNMPEHHRRFLLSFERGMPDWQLLGVTGADLLPAIRWRQQNLDRLPAHKRQALVDHLASILEQD